MLDYLKARTNSMKILTKTILPIITLNAMGKYFQEFVRNELLLKSFWIEHYQKFGLVFPSDPINGAIWDCGPFCLQFQFL